jgi:hypothetical protein
MEAFMTPMKLLALCLFLPLGLFALAVFLLMSWKRDKS